MEVTMEEISVLANVSMARVYQLAREREFPLSVRNEGVRKIYSRAAVIKWIEARDRKRRRFQRKRA